MIKKLLAILVVMSIANSIFIAQAAENNEEYTSQVYTQAAKSLQKYVSSMPNIKAPEYFESIVDCNDRAKIQNISLYIEFVYQNQFTFNEIETINRILQNGTTIQSLVQVYDFWLTTDEDFEMIEKICALENSYLSEHWFEDAFNALTDNSHGVMTSEDIQNYISKGLSADDIKAANVLCRKKGQNIFTILDRAADGISVPEQAKEVYGTNVVETTKSKYETISQIARDSSRKVLSEQMTSVYSKVIDEIADKHISRLKIEDTKTDIKEDIDSYNNSLYPISIKRALANKGYTAKEIECASGLYGFDIMQNIKEARRVMMYEK